MFLIKLLATGLIASGAFAAFRPYNAYRDKQFSQTFYDSYNILKHTGGIGPYTDRVGYGIDPNPPEGCPVDQVIMLMRHGERYPDSYSAAKIEPALAKVYASGITRWEGDLSFLNEWTSYLSNLAHLEQETFSGPYSGLLDAFKRGSEYSSRYGHLWDRVDHPNLRRWLRTRSRNSKIFRHGVLRLQLFDQRGNEHYI